MKKNKPSLVDNFIGVFSPGAKFKRLRSKLLTDLLLNNTKKYDNYWQRAYEGAGLGRRTQNWSTSDSSAIQEITATLPYLRQRSRDLIRNNGWAERAVRVIEANTIGRGIRSQITTIPQSKAKEKRVEIVWNSWTESKSIDFNQKMNFYGLQGLVLRSLVEGGDVLVRRRYNANNPNFPLTLQVLEGDFLDITKTGEEKGNPIIDGVEVNKKGVAVAYHIYEVHPGGNGTNNYSTESNRIPANEIMHIFRTDRAGQIRGVPWLAPVILPLRDIDDYQDAQRVRQKIAACFAVFFEQDAIDSDDPTTLDDNDLAKSKVEPGIMEEVPPGRKVTFANPPGVQNYKEFMSIELHQIAVAMGISYEALTGILEEVNFSSARMGWLEFGRNIEKWRWNLMIPQFCDRVFEWFLEAGNILGINPNGIKINWTPPKREMIDPTREVPAMIKAIRGGLLTLGEAVRMYGYDLEDHLNEYQKNNEDLDNRKIILDSDPRNMTQSGSLQKENADKEI